MTQQDGFNGLFCVTTACAGAFVHRHCANMGLPLEVATLATHLALARQVNTREYGIPEHAKGRTGTTWAWAQQIQVFLPILAVCKHLLKAAPMTKVRTATTWALCMSPGGVWYRANARS